MEHGPVKQSSMMKPCLISCVIVLFIVGVIIVGGIIWLMRSPESGVKMANEMDSYALKYIKEHKLLNNTESLIAYYDATMSMNGSEAAILTTEHVMYHKGGTTTSIALKDIADVQHRRESLVGDIIEVKSKSGMRLKIEIAPLNQGESFYNALMDAWKTAQS